MRCVLGLDSGGSKSDALLVRDDGIVLGHGYADYRDPGSGRSILGSGRSTATVSHAIARALGEHRCDELFFSGIGTVNPADVLPGDCVKHIRSDLVYESDPAFALAGTKSGIVVLAGTGGVVHVRRIDGRMGRFDGMGPLLGDFGSGYHIGLLTLRAVARALMHPSHSTLMQELVLAHLGFSNDKWPIARLMTFSLGQPDRAEIAGLALPAKHGRRSGRWPGHRHPAGSRGGHGGDGVRRH